MTIHGTYLPTAKTFTLRPWMFAAGYDFLRRVSGTSDPECGVVRSAGVAGVRKIILVDDNTLDNVGASSAGANAAQC